MENDLLVLEAPSVTSGFRILNSLSNVKLIDAEPVGGGRFLIVARSNVQDLRAISSSFAAVAVDVDFEIFEALSQEILDAVYSLAPNKIDESLIVLETSTVVAMFSLAQTFVKAHGLRAIEIKIRKTGASGSFAYFTGGREACENAAASARTYFAAKMREGSVEVLEAPSELTRSLFET